MVIVKPETLIGWHRQGFKLLWNTESRCDLILLHMRVPISDSVEMASLLRRKLPHVKVVGFSSVDLQDRGISCKWV